MKIGAPFNPYRVFQGAFAPFWLIEHKVLGAGAKLCYIRLLGFAGKDGHCYPSLETLGRSLGVSERQVRCYIRELEKAGLIAVEQRGLRRTNVYLFLWTAELDSLNTVCGEIGEPDAGTPQRNIGPEHESTSRPDRNDSSGQDRNGTTKRTRHGLLSSGGRSCSDSSTRGSGLADRNTPSGPDRNDSSGLDRKCSSGPIGKHSDGNDSLESSSASLVGGADQTMRRMGTENPSTETELSERSPNAPPPSTESVILSWAMNEGIRRRRADGAVGYPEQALVDEWAAILNGFCPLDSSRDVWIRSVMENARTAADRTHDWRNWTFLTLQIQLAAERTRSIEAKSRPIVSDVPPALPEDPTCEWARIKTEIRRAIGEIPFTNWFQASRQTAYNGGSVTVELTDVQTKAYIETEYLDVVAYVSSTFGVSEVNFVVGAESAPESEGCTIGMEFAREERTAGRFVLHAGPET